ncbi:MAG: IS5/IS1182 family transposase, partial [Xanthomonadaceae bacterium]|nr:IS5/IS1182 family transposase [Xanthomonadaceae bacterium]MBS3924585.1 IS5/IS1182 family transposase [Xanthomonadaceae bacterium]MBS3924598.1 IS5/IS1182 family transposase [Xanthomonadaceae bacterium]
MPTERDIESAEASLFVDLPLPSAEQVQQAQAKAVAKRGHGAPRLLEPNRRQIQLRASDLESLLAPDHRARL